VTDGIEPIVGEDFDVFISYAHADEEADGDRGPAQTLAAMLEAEGYSVWWDRQLIGGEDWLRELPTKIGFARKVIALVSPRWMASKDCYAELMRAYETPDKLVPVFIADCAPPVPIAHLNAIRAFGNLTLAKPLILAALGGIEPSNKPKPSTPSRLSADDIGLDGLPTGASRLFGRDVELTTLLEAWASGSAGAAPAGKTNAVVLHAIGGAGKSALLRAFLDALEEKGFPGAAKVYGWSAYSQGSGDNRNADADGFISKALRFFGHDLAEKPITDPVERGRTLARLIRRQRTLLVLDGLEPLQDVPHVNEGRLKDRGLQALITQLAKENPGLLVVTSRQELPELAQAKRQAVINHALDSLNDRAGAELLKHLGVHGRETELMAAVREVGGHALSVSLLGTYLSAVCGGDVARRDTLRFYDLVDSQADTPHDRQARRANRIMDAYVERFERLTKRQAKSEGDVERLILSLIGLFDRPAEADALATVLAAPPIPGLTGGWHALTPQQKKLRWSFALKRLRALKLIASEGVRPSESDATAPRTEGPNHSAAGARVSDPEGLTPLDAHPIVRQHFGRRLKEGASAAFREANRRLYKHYMALPEKLYRKEEPDTLEEMQPLFSAIAHGCAAGLHRGAFRVFWDRIQRQDDFYTTSKLGAFSSDLAALAHFFELPWGRPHPNLKLADQGVVLNLAGFRLRALGRLREAVEPITAAVRLYATGERRSQYYRRQAALNGINLSDLLLTLGDIGPAVAVARESVQHADKSNDGSQSVLNLAMLADALHQAGDSREAEKQFAKAEQRQRKRPPWEQLLYAMRGYQSFVLQLGQGRHAQVLERAKYGLQTVRSGSHTLGASFNLLDIALNTLSLGRATHQAWRASSPPLSQGGDRAGRQANARLGSAPPPDPLLTEERVQTEAHEEKVAAARDHLDAAVEALRKAGREDQVPRGLLARAAFRRDTGEWDKAQEDLAEVYEIASRSGMRLFLADYHLERARLLLVQIPGVTPPDEWTLALARAGAAAPTVAALPPAAQPDGWLARLKSALGLSSPTPVQPPTLTAADQAFVAEADRAWNEANALIRATGYHRRDDELSALRIAIDRGGAG
jgi:tetratricopeptide (TPR) repeat protein